MDVETEDAVRQLVAVARGAAEICERFEGNCPALVVVAAALDSAVADVDKLLAK